MKPKEHLQKKMYTLCLFFQGIVNRHLLFVGLASFVYDFYILLYLNVKLFSSNGAKLLFFPSFIYPLYK